MANRGRRGRHHRRYNADNADVLFRAFITVLLTHCYAATAILYKKGDGSENAQRNFKVEDFLWSGSGNGENETDISATTYIDDEIWWEYATKTVVQTTTVISIAISTSTATVYREIRPRFTVTNGAATITVSKPTSPGTVARCVENAECDIRPSPTIRVPSETRVAPRPTIPSSTPTTRAVPEQQYWLITVLKLNVSATKAAGIVFTVVELEDRLTRLYKLAFLRRVERYLEAGEDDIGGDAEEEKNRNQNHKSTIRSLRSSLRRPERWHEDVTVQVHNVTAENALLRILYTVSVAEQPILATSAAGRMKLVTDAEMVAEFGYPVLMKAEPYLKSGSFSSNESVAFAGWKKKHIVFIVTGVIIAAIIVLLLTLLFVAVNKHERSRNIAAALAGTKILKMRKTERDDNHKTYKHKITPKRSTGDEMPMTRAITVETVDQGRISRAQSAEIATSSRSLRPNTSESTMRTHLDEPDNRPFGVKRPAPPTPRPRSSTSSARKVATDVTERTRNVIGSPNSFLSMPSVKDFPTAYLPEPLTNVLNNENDDDRRAVDKHHPTTDRTDRMYSRHSSFGGDDPGVLGPIVWKTYRQQTQRQRPFPENERPTVTFSDTTTTEELAEHVHYCCTLDGDQHCSQDRNSYEEDDEYEKSSRTNSVVTRTKERFNRLLDEALNLYREGNAGASNLQARIRVERKDVSNLQPSTEEKDVEGSVPSDDTKRRPKTSSVDAAGDRQSRGKRFQEVRTGWCGSVLSTPARLNLLRPLSAGPFHRPIVRPEFILADSRLLPDDPAVSVIEAIKREIDKIPDRARENNESSASITRSQSPESSPASLSSL